MLGVCVTGRGQCRLGAAGEGNYDDILGKMRKEEGRTFGLTTFK